MFVEAHIKDLNPGKAHPPEPDLRKNGRHLMTAYFFLQKAHMQKIKVVKTKCKML